MTMMNKCATCFSWLTLVLIALSVIRSSDAKTTEKRVKFFSIKNFEESNIPKDMIDDASSSVEINHNSLQSSESDSNESVESLESVEVKEKKAIQSKNSIQGLHIDPSIFPIKYLTTKASAPTTTRSKVKRNQVNYTVKHHSSRISATKPRIKTGANNEEDKMLTFESRKLLNNRQPKAIAQKYTSNYRDPAHVKTQYSELPKFLYDHQVNYPVSAADGLKKMDITQHRVPLKNEKTTLQPFSLPDEFRNRVDSQLNAMHYYDEFYPSRPLDSNNNHKLKHPRQHTRYHPYQFEDTFKKPELFSEEIYTKNGPPYGTLQISNIEPSRPRDLHSGRNVTNEKPRTTTKSPPKKYVTPKIPSNSKPRPLSRPTVTPTNYSSQKYYKRVAPKLLINYPSDESKYSATDAVLTHSQLKNEKQMKPDDFKYFQDIYSAQLSPDKIEFGHVAETPSGWEERFELQDHGANRHQGKVKWADKNGGFGEHLWDLNHVKAGKNDTHI